jgi:hypothetical protein
LNFVWSWFGLLFTNWIMMFAILKGTKSYYLIKFLFQDDVDIVAYWTIW